MSNEEKKATETVKVTRADARTALLAVVAGMFDRISGHTDGMANETRISYEDLGTMIGSPRKRNAWTVASVDAEGKKTYAFEKNADGSFKLDDDGKQIHVTHEETVTDAPDLTMMIA